MKSVIYFTKEMPPKGESVQTYVPAEIKRKLEEWAKEEQRSISFLVAQLIIEAVETRNQQKQPPAQSEKTAKAGNGGKQDKGR